MLQNQTFHVKISTLCTRCACIVKKQKLSASHLRAENAAVVNKKLFFYGGYFVSAFFMKSIGYRCKALYRHHWWDCHAKGG